MKKIVALFLALLMVCAFSTSAFAAVACVRSGCFNGLVNAYCGGDKSYKGYTHTYYKPFWPLGATECEYVIDTHYTYGICNSCGYRYDSSSGLVLDHASEYSHDYECPKYDSAAGMLPCEYGDLLSWYL